MRVWLLIAAFAALGCKGTGDVDAHYRTRGEVKNFTGTGEDARAAIHHERIAEFKDRDGKPSPMDAMQMNFALAPGVDPKPFQAGAKLAFEFDVRWSSGSPLVITRVEALPAETALDFSDSH